MDARINVTMPKAFLRRVDEYSLREHRSRSELIREALRSYMAEQDEAQEKATKRQKALAAAALLDKLAAKVEPFDAVREIRKMRDER